MSRRSPLPFPQLGRVLLCTALAMALPAGAGLTVEQGEALQAKAQSGDKAALRQIEQGAARGDVQAQVHMALLYLDGGVVKENFPEAITWFAKAGNQGSTYAQYFVGTLYWANNLESKGIKRNPELATAWFVKAASDGGGLYACRALDRLQKMKEFGHWNGDAAPLAARLSC